jgi:ubiquinol-cytochrome c reductase cytochrome c1 subunit
MKKWAIILLALLPLLGFASEGGGDEALMKAPVNLQDRVSLQHGAKLFVNYCMGCHSMKYLRYGRMAEDLGIKPALAQENLIFTGAKIGSEMVSSMRTEDAKTWFGAPPPDLSFEARFRSPDWIYSYLLGFYSDASRPFGDNNKVFEKVAMPDVLYNMRHNLDETQFKQNVADLTNFLTYAAEPIQEERKRIGVHVLVFLLILLIPVYLMKREFWKDVH